MRSPKRLEGWKDIARYLGRDVRSVQRWEHERGLPIHRVPGGKGNVVYALSDEIERWLAGAGASESHAEASPAALARWIRLDEGDGAQATRKRCTIAVLPFVNFSGNAEQEYFADGLTDEVIAPLCAIDPEQLSVIARTSVMTYKNSNKRADEIARELNADLLLEGSVQRTEERTRVNVRLINATSQSTVWGAGFERASADILSLQADIATATAQATRASLQPHEPSLLQPAAAVDPAAYDLYLRGNAQYALRSLPSMQHARDLYDQALALDSTIAAAHAMRGSVELALASLGMAPFARAADTAERFLDQALERAPRLGSAHVDLGYIYAFRDHDWSGAHCAYQEGLRFSPGAANSRLRYLTLLTALGDFDGADHHAAVAARLDPASPAGISGPAQVAFWRGDYRAAANDLEAIVERFPSNLFSYLLLGVCYAMLGEEARARDACATAREMSHDSSTALAIQAIALASLKRTGEAQGLADQLEAAREREGFVVAYFMASVHALLGHPDKALDYLEASYSAREFQLPTVRYSPWFAPLRRTPRFHALLDRLHLPGMPTRAV